MDTYSETLADTVRVVRDRLAREGWSHTERMYVLSLVLIISASREGHGGRLFAALGTLPDLPVVRKYELAEIATRYFREAMEVAA